MAAPRSAFAPDGPYVIMAGTVDPSFYSTNDLELFHGDFTYDSLDLPVAASIPSDYRLSLSLPVAASIPSDYRLSLSLPAHASHDFSLGLWNPKALLSSDLDWAVAAKHTGPVPVPGLELKPNQLVSGAEAEAEADGGELCISDFENPRKPNLKRKRKRNFK